MSEKYLCKHCSNVIDLITCFDFDGLCGSCFDYDMKKYTPSDDEEGAE